MSKRGRDYDFWTVQTIVGIHQEFQRIRDYLSSFNGHLTQREDDFEKRVKDYKANPDEDVDGYYAEQLDEEALQLEGYGQILRNMALASLCTYFELEVVTLARADFRKRERAKFEEHQKLQLAARKAINRYNDLPNYWKERRLTYLQHVKWEEITKIRDVRNKIAHTNGQLGDDNESKRVREYVGRRENDGKTSLQIKADLIDVQPEYCDEVSQVFNEFLVEMVYDVAAIYPIETESSPSSTVIPAI